MHNHCPARPPQLGARLAAIAALVRPGAVVADIGTDHAKLPVHLIREQTALVCLACDIAPSPLSRAEQNVCAAGLSEHIPLLLCNGLSHPTLQEKLCDADFADIVIAGMGGENIAAIIEAAEWLRDIRYATKFRLLLQPMTRAAHLYRALNDIGYMLIEENNIHEGKKDYVICVFSFLQHTEESSC